MRNLLFVVLTLLAGQAFAEAEKPPAPPPGWDTSRPSTVPKTPVQRIVKVEPAAYDPFLITRAELKEIVAKVLSPKINNLKKFLKTSGLTPNQKLSAQNELKDLQSMDAPGFSPTDADHNIGMLSSIKVNQIVDDANMIVEIFDDTVWIEGIDTSGLVDGKSYILTKAIVKLNGTKQYSTVLGSTKTIFKATAMKVRD